MKEIKAMTKTRIIPAATVLMLLSIFGISDRALAQTAGGTSSGPIADTPCDPKYYDSLEARAWLEAQREITQNQNLIFKADSVLEYTCFDKFANVLAQQAETMFSENSTRWGPVPGITNKNMDKALDGLVGDALVSYIGSNFSHPFLGGRWPTLVPAAPAPSDYTPGTISGGTYSCDVMDKVWAQAKCIDFIENPTEDGFYTFADYQSQDDKRFLPTRCGKDTRWSEMINVAVGLEAAGGTARIWPDDPVITYLDRMDPANCGGDPNIYPPIETGIEVRRPKQDPTNYDEYVCIQPGCHYDPASETCTK